MLKNKAYKFRIYPNEKQKELIEKTFGYELAKIIASKLNKAKGKTIFLMPLKGVSMLDAEGGPFYDPDADKAFLDTLKENLSDNVELILVDAHVNDPAFAEKAAELLMQNL